MGAVGTMRMLAVFRIRSEGSMLSVITRLFITDFWMRSTAGPDSTPWVI